MILGLLSLFLVLFKKKKYNWLYVTGIVSILIQYNFVYAISKHPEELESEYLDYQFQPEFGFGLLTLGAVLVISSAILHSSNKRDSHNKTGTSQRNEENPPSPKDWRAKTRYQVTLCAENESFTAESYDKACEYLQIKLNLPENALPSESSAPETLELAQDGKVIARIQRNSS